MSSRREILNLFSQFFLGAQNEAKLVQRERILSSLKRSVAFARFGVTDVQ